MSIIKNQTIVYSLLLVVFACQLAHGESDSGNSYLGNMKDLFLKEEQAVTPTQSSLPNNKPGLQRSYNHCSVLKFYYIAIPEFDSTSYELLKFSYKSDKVPFLAFGTTAYERIGRLTAKNHPYIYSVLPLSVYIDLDHDEFSYSNPYLFVKYSNWGRYSNPDSIKTSYLSYGIALGEMVLNMELGVLHINNNRLKDDFYYISIGFDIGLGIVMGMGGQP